MSRKTKSGGAAKWVALGVGVAALFAVSIGVAFHLGKRSAEPESLRKPTGLKVMLLGVDGAEWTILNPLMEQGKLPNFSKLIHNGASGRFHSLEPILSPIIWTTIATGKNPEKHGISWFMVKDPEHSRRFPVQSTMRKTKAIWNILSENDANVGVAGWWASYPAEHVNGFIVSDYIAYHAFGLSGQDAKASVGKTYPPELYNDVVKYLKDPLKVPKKDLDKFMKLTDKEYDFSVNTDFDFGNPLHHFMYAYVTGSFYRDVGLDLYKKYKPDLMAVYFEQVDSVSHIYMKYTPPQMEGMPDEFYNKYNNLVYAYYERQDKILGQFMDAADKDTVIIVCSDHGFKTGKDRLTENQVTSVAQAHMWHKIYGVFIMWGPPVREGIEIDGAAVQDVTPTILYLLGLPVARDMDGKVLLDALKLDFVKDHPVRTIDSYETGTQAVAQTAQPSEVDEAVMEKLKALGYIGDDLDDSGIRNNRIDVLMKKGDFDGALAEAEAVLAKDPDMKSMLLTKARILERKGMVIDAEKLYRQIAEEAWGDVPPMDRIPVSQALQTVAVYNHMAGKPDDAIKALERSLELNPQNPDAEYNLGVMYEGRGDNEKAVEHYKKAIELKPDLALAHNNLGNCYQKTGEIQKAIEQYQKTAEIDPRHIECHFNLGVLYSSIGKQDDAKKEFEKALEISPTFVPAKLALGDYYLASGNNSEALKIFEDVISKDPHNPQYLYLYAKALAASGKKTEARSRIEEAEKIDPQGVERSLQRDPQFRKLLGK